MRVKILEIQPATPAPTLRSVWTNPIIGITLFWAKAIAMPVIKRARTIIQAFAGTVVLFCTLELVFSSEDISTLQTVIAEDVTALQRCGRPIA